MKKQCVICNDWFTMEAVGLNPTNNKHVGAFNRRTICEKPLCATKRRRRHQNESFAKNADKATSKVCDMCGVRFYPIDHGLDMREIVGRNTWASTKRCPSPACQAQAVKKLRERHSRGLGHTDEGLENSLLLSELRDWAFDPIQEVSADQYYRYRVMMGKRV